MIKFLFKRYIEKAVIDVLSQEVKDVTENHLKYGYGVDEYIKQAIRNVAYCVVYEEAKKKGIVDSLALEVVEKINTMQIKGKE